MKNRSLAILLTLIIICSTLSPAANAAAISGTCGESATWHYDSTTATLTISGTGAMADYPYSAVDEDLHPWHPYNDTIETVVIQDGITYIGDNAFSRVTNMTKIQIPDTVTAIGDSFLTECRYLTEVTIPDSVTSIGDNTFSECNRLTKATLPSSLTEIPVDMFEGCTALSSIHIPDTVTTIGTRAFDGCRSLSAIPLPDTLTTIGSEAFAGCAGLTEIALPNTVTSIDTRMFEGCSNLTDVTLPETLPGIPSGTFQSCVSLTHINLPDTVTSIGANAFDSCLKLQSITFPKGLTNIKTRAFSNCEILLNIAFLGDAPEIGTNAFYEVATNAYYPVDNTTWTDAVFQDYGGAIVWYGVEDPANAEMPTDHGACGTDTTWALADGVLTISGTGRMDRAPWKGFKDQIVEVVIEEGVTNIVDSAFQSFTSLTKVTLPQGLTEIGSTAFDYCHSLTEIDLPNSLTTIRQLAFVDCWGLTSVTIPENVKTIEYGAFNDCTSLTNIRFEGPGPDMDSCVFENVTATVEYPADQAGWNDPCQLQNNSALTWVAYCSGKHTRPDGTVITAPTCTETGLVSCVCPVCGEKYQVRTPALGHSMENGFCTVCGFEGLPTPSILSCYSKLQTSVKVTWTLIDGAEGYELWRSTAPDGTYTIVKTIRDGNKDRYTNQGLTIGTTYYYKVRAYTHDPATGQRICSEFSDIDHMPAAVVFNEPYSIRTTNIRLRWHQVDGSHGYQIWRKDPDGNYRIVKTIGDKGNTLTEDKGSTTGYTNSGLNAGDTHTYKMRAFMICEDGRKIFGAYSDEITIAVQPQQPSLTATAGPGRAYLSWNAVNGASGYQIWINGTEISQSIAKTITDGSITEYTKYQLVSGRTYTFQITSFVEIDGRRTFSEKNGSVTITIP